ncbi:hypothetical protein J8657_06715 [Dickeya oryzae]|uniref:O-methyltransferase n=1 Tax=Dickeya oryzae TaxID=1240404 RepID=A0AB39IV13_9GAMM|nr:hypothetical protein [Dickeya oryzae]MBP2857290.1 hypothetical protein [Dickeya oryzae]MCA6989325.1 hypothetical protein [Dickeya oryzae]
MPGTAYQIICNALNNNPEFHSFRENQISRKEYFKNIVEKKDSLLGREFNEDMLNLSARMPSDPDAFVDELLNELYKMDIIPNTIYDKNLYSNTEKIIAENFLHRDRKTFIFPEESRLIFALADILKPKRIAFMGSYYAFWAIWTLPVLPNGSSIWLMDIDETCQVLARENITSLGLGKQVNIYHESQDAIASITNITDLDWIVLDAEGPKTGPDDEDLIDKAIYYPMIRQGYTSLNEGGLMIAHNILLENTTDSPYIQEKIDWNTKMFSKFIPFLNQNFRSFTHFESTEGVGIAKK